MQQVSLAQLHHNFEIFFIGLHCVIENSVLYLYGSSLLLGRSVLNGIALA